MTAPRRLPGFDESFWMDTTDAPVHPPLTEDIEVDVAVVGGGIAGLSTAWEPARAGRTVAVPEADRIAAGVSGYTTAKVSALHSLVYERLRETRGTEGARLYAASQQDAVERVAGIVGDLGIDCDFERARLLVRRHPLVGRGTPGGDPRRRRRGGAPGAGGQAP